jgi:hypothetical protein
MAFHIFRRQAVYCWRRRTPRALAKVLGRQHLSMSLQTTNRAAARRLAAQVNLFLDDVAMLADGTDQLSRSQIETMLRAVVEKQMAKLDRVAFAAKNAPGFDVDQARSDDRRALWTFTLLDAQGHSATVRPQDRDRMIAEGLSEADIEAVKRHLAMLRANDMVPTKYQVLRQMTAVTPGRAKSHTEGGTVVEAVYSAGETRHFVYGKGEYKFHDLENVGVADLWFTTVEFLNSANAPLELGL